MIQATQFSTTSVRWATHEFGLIHSTDQGDSDKSDIEIACHELSKNWCSMSMVKFFRTIVKSFCMKSLIHLFFPDALLSSRCSWDTMKLI